MQRQQVLVILLLAVPVMAAATVSASPVCGSGRVGAPSYEYCAWGDAHGTKDRGDTTTTTTGEAGAATEGPGTDGRLDATALRSEARERESGTSEADATRAQSNGRAAYRTGWSADTSFGQARETDAQGSQQEHAAVASASATDPMLRDVGVRVTHAQQREDAPCQERATVEVTLIADTIRLAPSGECRAPLPWLDLAVVTVAASAAR